MPIGGAPLPRGRPIGNNAGPTGKLLAALRNPPVTLPATAANSSSHLIPECFARPGDDPIFALNAVALRRASAGDDILNATLGALMEDDGRLAILPSVRDALSAVPPERAAAYAPIAGEPAYLAAVIEDLYGEGPLASRSVAVATPGGTGAVHHAVVNFLEQGESLLVPDYYWGPYRIVANHAQRATDTFRMFDEQCRFDRSAFCEAVEAQSKRQQRLLIVLNTPCNNPTGYTLDDADWQAVSGALREASQRVHVTLLIDLAYARFGSPDSPRWQDHVEALSGDVLPLIAWTASKTFAQYGARIGALVASHPDEAERARISNALSYSCRGTWSNCNHHGMLAVTELLADPELRARSDSERDRLRLLLGARVTAFNELAEAAQLRHPRYEGGFFVTVFTPDAQATVAKMQELGVFVVPLDGGVRVALCSTPTAQVPRLVDALAAGVAAAKG